MITDSFSQKSLLEQLPKLNIDQGPRAFSAEERAYIGRYQIDFVNHFPGLNYYLGTVEAAGYSIVGNCWVPDRPRGTVLVVHGLFDHAGLYGHLIRHLLASSYAVFCFDLPGHGLSEGQPAVIGSFDEYVQSFEACMQIAISKLPSPLHIIGQSTGSAIIMEWLLSSGATTKGLEPSKVILLAPLVRPYQWNRNRYLYWALKLFVNERPRQFADGSEDWDFQKFVRDHDPLQARVLPIAWIKAMVKWKNQFIKYAPTDISPRVIQGDHDTTVDWNYNLGVIEEKFKARTLLVPGARHHLVNENSAMRAIIFKAVLDEIEGNAD